VLILFEFASLGYFCESRLIQDTRIRECPSIEAECESFGIRGGIHHSIDMVARIDPSAGPKKYAFSVSATMNQVWMST
jgi:hypothetical protein